MSGQRKHGMETSGARHVPVPADGLWRTLTRRNAWPRRRWPQIPSRAATQTAKISSSSLKEHQVPACPTTCLLPDLSIYNETIGLKTGLISDQPACRAKRSHNLERRYARNGRRIRHRQMGPSRPDWDRFETDWAGSIKWTRKNYRGFLTIEFAVGTREVNSSTLRPVTRRRGQTRSSSSRSRTFARPTRSNGRSSSRDSKRRRRLQVAVPFV
jgi:hypothetical protein